MANPYDIRRAERYGMPDPDIQCVICEGRANGGIRNALHQPICYECKLRLRSGFLDFALPYLEEIALGAGIDQRFLGDVLLDALDTIEDHYYEKI